MKAVSPVGSMAMALTLLVALASEASAGPPFVSDDPEPTDTGYWEIYNFA